MNADQVRDRLKTAIEAHEQPTRLAWAVANGMAPSTVSEFLNGTGDAVPAVILKALGLVAVVEYVEAAS